jgi:hypothetical protein
MKEADDALPEDVLRLREQIQAWAEENGLWSNAGWRRPDEESGWVQNEETPTVLILWYGARLYRVFWEPDDESEKLHREFGEMLKRAGFSYDFEDEQTLFIYRMRKRQGPAN